MKVILKQIIITIIQLEAKWVLKKYNPRIVAVTGSVGKTSTKDAIYSVLSSAYFVRKSEKSFNGDIGVPLTILGLQNGWTNIFAWLENIFKGLMLVLFEHPYPEWLVLEIGADRPGDIEKIMSWVKPDISVITRIGEVPVHVEFFKDRTKLVQEKSFLAQGLKTGGVLILNADDLEVLNFANLAPASAKKVTVSVKGGADFVASNFETLSRSGLPSGIAFSVTCNGQTTKIERWGVLGTHHIYPALLAFAVGAALGLDLEKSASVLGQEVNTPGRMHLVSGLKDSLIIDDSYNASPVAMAEAIQTLAEVKTPGRKIAVLGDMMELGKHSSEAHLQTGLAVGKVVDILVTVGMRARRIAEGALNIGIDEAKVFQFDGAREAGKWIEARLQAGDIVLVKGSQSVRLERVVKEIMRDPDQAETLLARQDEEWQKR